MLTYNIVVHIYLIKDNIRVFFDNVLRMFKKLVSNRVNILGRNEHFKFQEDIVKVDSI